MKSCLRSTEVKNFNELNFTAEKKLSQERPEWRILEYPVLRLSIFHNPNLSNRSFKEIKRKKIFFKLNSIYKLNNGLICSLRKLNKEYYV